MLCVFSFLIPQLERASTSGFDVSLIPVPCQEKPRPLKPSDQQFRPGANHGTLGLPVTSTAGCDSIPGPTCDSLYVSSHFSATVCTSQQFPSQVLPKDSDVCQITDRDLARKRAYGHSDRNFERASQSRPHTNHHRFVTRSWGRVFVAEHWFGCLGSGHERKKLPSAPGAEKRPPLCVKAVNKWERKRKREKEREKKKERERERERESLR